MAKEKPPTNVENLIIKHTSQAKHRAEDRTPLTDRNPKPNLLSRLREGKDGH